MWTLALDRPQTTQMTTTASIPKVDGLAGDARCGWCDGECSECAEVLVRLVQTRMWPRPIRGPSGRAAAMCTCQCADAEMCGACVEHVQCSGIVF